MSEDRQPVHVLIADLSRPESRSALEEFTGLGDLRDRIYALARGGTGYVAVLVGSGVAIVPLPTLKDLVSFQRILIDLAVNLGIVQPVPLELDDATHRLLVRDLDMQVLQTGDAVAGHA
jgi:hypothetical protein